MLTDLVYVGTGDVLYDRRLFFTGPSRDKRAYNIKISKLKSMHENGKL